MRGVFYTSSSELVSIEAVKLDTIVAIKTAFIEGFLKEFICNAHFMFSKTSSIVNFTACDFQ